MLFLKMVVLHTSTLVTNDRFRFFGLFWFTLADFIPRGFPSLAFVALMMYSRRDTTSTDLNKEFLHHGGTELNGDILFDEYRDGLDGSSNGPPAGHFTFLSDGYSPRAGGYNFYDELAYYEDDANMETQDEEHMNALGYKSPKSRSPTKGRTLSHTEV